MGKVNPDNYGGDFETKTLMPDMLGEDVNAAVLTITEFRDPDVGGRAAPLLEFKEFPDCAMWLNRRDVRTLVAKLGDDDDEWVGKKVPVLRQRVQNPKNKEFKETLHIAFSERWEEIFDEFARTTKQVRSRNRRK